VALFLKDRNTPHELARSVLQFMKISVTLLSNELLEDKDSGVAKFMLDNMFHLKVSHHIKKHKLIVRKILSKLIRKCTAPFVTRLMPEYHRPIVAYIEREKRKKVNKKEKERLLALMGKQGADKALATVAQEGAGAETDSDTSSEDEENSIRNERKGILNDDIDSEGDIGDSDDETGP